MSKETIGINTGTAFHESVPQADKFIKIGIKLKISYLYTGGEITIHYLQDGQAKQKITSGINTAGIDILADMGSPIVFYSTITDIGDTDIMVYQNTIGTNSEEYSYGRENKAFAAELNISSSVLFTGKARIAYVLRSGTLDIGNPDGAG